MEKTNFTELLEKLNELKETVHDSQITTLNQVIQKLNNIMLITDAADENMKGMLISKKESNSINMLINNYLKKQNPLDLSGINNLLDSIIKKLIPEMDFALFISDTANIKKYLTRFQTTVNKQKNTFEVETNKIIEKAQEIENLKTKYEEEYTTLESKYITKFDNLSDRINEKDEKISELIGIIGEKASVGKYDEFAKSAKKERIIWQLSTITLILIAFGISWTIVNQIFCYVKNGYDMDNFWLITFAKIIVGGTLIMGSIYTGKQGASSRKDEVYYRRQQLELATMDIYLADLEESDRQDIKKALATKIFGQAQSSNGDDNKIFSINDLLKLANSVKK